MKNNLSKQIEYFTFEKFGFSSIPHGFFTRNGGISPVPWNSLNLSTSGGDSRENVVENRKRVFDSIERPVESLYDAWQVHGTTIIQVNEPRGLDNSPQKADGLVTNKANVTLFMRFADCVPILLFDPINHVIGIFHAGWKGTLDKIVGKGVKVFCDTYHSEAKNIIAGIGPSICSNHYIIREDVASKVEEVFKTRVGEVLSHDEGNLHFDLAKSNQIILLDAGVSKIENSNICTACDTGKWFSHRAEKGSTGRFGAFVGLQ